MHILDKIYLAEKHCKRASAIYQEWRGQRLPGQFLSQNKRMQGVVWQIIEMVTILAVLRPAQADNYNKVTLLLFDELREQPPPPPPAPRASLPAGHDFCIFAG